MNIFFNLFLICTTTQEDIKLASLRNLQQEDIKLASLRNLQQEDIELASLRNLQQEDIELASSSNVQQEDIKLASSSNVQQESVSNIAPRKEKKNKLRDALCLPSLQGLYFLIFILSIVGGLSILVGGIFTNQSLEMIIGSGILFIDLLIIIYKCLIKPLSRIFRK